MNDARDSSPGDGPGPSPDTPAAPDAESEVLLSAFSQGDDSALGRLVERETPRLAEHLRRRLPPHLQPRIGVSDVVQQTSIELLAVRERFENRGYGAFRTLLKLIAERVLANAIEREHAARRDVLREVGRPTPRADSSEASTRMHRLASNSDTPSRVAMRREDIDAMKACLAKLRAPDREIVRLIDHEGLPYSEAAEKLGISVDAAMKRHSRAIERLRALMG